MGKLIKNIGLSAAEIIKWGELKKINPETVYLSGSRIEGFGNKYSDIDVFVISDEVIAGPIFIRKKNFAINIILHGNRRIDYEFWKHKHFTELSGQIKKIKLGKEFVAEKLAANDELLIHRLKCGLPLTNPAAFEKLKALFDFNRFSGYLVQQSGHQIDGALEDISGLYEDKDWEMAIVRCIMLVHICVDCYTYFNGLTNTLPKWRIKKLNLAREKKFRDADFMTGKFWKLAFPNPARLLKQEKFISAYVKECVALSHFVTENYNVHKYGC